MSLYRGRRFGRSPVALVLGMTLSVAGPATAVTVADSGGTNTIKVLPGTTTITPIGTGASFSVNVVGNGSVDIGGAGAGLTFDKTRLTLTAVTKDAAVFADGATFVGIPSMVNTPAFLATANGSGQIPVIAWYFTDGVSFEPANSDIGIFSATFSVKATGDSAISPFVGTVGGLTDGTAVNYGTGLALASLASATVVNTRPTASISAVPTWVATNSIVLTWGGSAGTNPIASYDIRYRKAPYSGTFGAFTLWKSATALTMAGFTTAPGYRYCFSEAVRDTLGNLSTWSAETCTSAPLDDRSLTRSGSWTLGTGSAYYRSTFLKSTSTTAKLTRTSVQAKRIAIVATTCKTCGSVRVYWGTTLIKTVNLYSATTVNKKLVTIVTWTSVNTGTFSLKPGSAGKATIIDGVVFSRT